MGVAEAFLSSGANVHIISRSQQSLDSALSILKGEYPNPELTISGSTSDVLNESEITQELLKVAPVDHIVYTAVDKRIRGPIGEVDVADAQELFGVKFWGQVGVAKGTVLDHSVRTHSYILYLLFAST